jgi:ATP-binding cassette subfamily F protein uup
LLLARLFKRPSNLLILDEPTNDLDEETLELLEEIVSNYEGTLLLVSHDREFLNNVVTSVIALDGNGNVHEYGGGYDDYVRQRSRQTELEGTPSSTSSGSNGSKSTSTTSTAAPAKAAKSKLSFKEQRELEAIPTKIEQAEAERERIHLDMASPDFYQQDSSRISTTVARLATLDNELAQLYSRWEELESRNQ